jgi:cullin-associated NEDD8-dissociated protein 1
MSSFTVNAILEKTENRDKDFRYMATSDLLAELSKEAFKPDSDGERRMCRCLLKLINDQSSDVQSLAVKCLSPLVRKVHEERVEEIMTALVSHLLSGTDEQRDISSIGLKTVVLEMPASMAPVALRLLTPQLVVGVQKEKLEVKLESLEVLNDLLRRFAAHLAETDSHDCLAALFGELHSPRAAARKRAIACIASLAASLPDRILEEQLVGAIFEQMAEPKLKLDLRRTYIQTLSAVSRSGGYRLARQLDRVIPLILQQCEPGKAADDAELIESCLQAFESFVLRCPKEVAPYQQSVGEAALTFLKYDPNYADDDDDDEMEEEEEEEEDEEDEDYSDDDDVSWKVRRAAAKVLSSLIVSAPERLPTLVPLLTPTLVQRFSEREENVKMDVFSTFNDLLQQVAATSGAGAGVGGSAPDASGSADAMVVDTAPSDGGDGSTAALLAVEVPRVAKAAARQLKAKSAKTRIAAFHCLRQLVTSLPGCLSSHVALLIPGLDKALKDGASSPLRIEALLFLSQALPSHPPGTFQPYLSSILPPVVSLADDRYYRTVAEALRVLCEVVKVFRPSPPSVGFAYDALVPSLYAVVERRLQAQDQDQEVKECAIQCMGLIIAHLADHSAVRLEGILPLLLDRLRNEITRVTTVKTFGAIAAAKLDVKLTLPAGGGSGGTVLAAMVGEMCSFLRKSSRPLRQASLIALDTVVAGHSANLSDADVSSLIGEIAPLVTDSDLHVAHLALTLARTVVVAKSTRLAVPLKELLLPKAVVLLQSSVLQGVALRSLLAFFAELVNQSLPQLSFDALSTLLLGLPGQAALSRHSLTALSQAVAACCLKAPAAQAQTMVAAFAAQLASPPDATLALLCLGEIGKLIDLSASSATLLPAVRAAFDAPDEDTRASASYALGNIAAGNLRAFVPSLLSAMDSSGPHDYLILHAVKDMLGSGSAELSEYTGQLLPKLLAYAERDEEGMRNVVSECLGRLAAVAPDSVVPQLSALLTSESAATRATVTSCVRFAITELGSRPIPPTLQTALLPLLQLIEDPDLKVRRGALLTLNCLVHNKPHAIHDGLPTLLPLLYVETVKRAELIHQVDLGPFKHTVDDGLEVRKAAFEAMETVLSRCADRIDFGAFLERLVLGLKDDGDIKLLCHRMVIELSGMVRAAPAVLASLESMCEPLRLTLCATLKDNAVKQQIERHWETLRSAMRACRALEKLSGTEGVPKFADLCRLTLRGAKLADRYAAICAEDEVKPGDGD